MIVLPTDRVAVRRGLQIRCQVVRERDGRLIGARAVDLSTHGMLVRSEADIVVGDPVHVSFRATDFDIRFDTQATVTRVVEGRRRYDRGRCLGLRFLSLGALARHLLRGQLRRVPPTLPARAQRVDYAGMVRRIAEEPSIPSRVASASRLDLFLPDDDVILLA